MECDMVKMNIGWLAFALVVGCADSDADKSDGMDTATAEAVWAEIEGYEDWAQMEGYEGVLPATSVHNSHVQIWLNDIAMEDATNGVPLSDGAIVVKDTYADADGASLNDISILKRIDGYSADADDIFYAQYAPDGSINTAGTPDGCVGCHIAEDTDGDGLTFNEE